jgi:hypothetical protein
VVRPTSLLETGRLGLGEAQIQAHGLSQQQAALTGPERESSHQVRGAIALPPSPFP